VAPSTEARTNHNQRIRKDANFCDIINKLMDEHKMTMTYGVCHPIRAFQKVQFTRGAQDVLWASLGGNKHIQAQQARIHLQHHNPLSNQN
jgi:hypothetical protein